MRLYSEPSVTEGFHGTDTETAHRILDKGFDDTRYETWFALPDDLWLAQQHGQKNGSRAGTNHFAVLGVTFPEVAVDYSDYGKAVCLFKAEIGQVAVRSMAVYDTATGDLIETYDLDHQIS